MKRSIFSILLILSTILTAGSCVKESLRAPRSNSEGVVDLVLTFGSPKGPAVEVGTKGGLGIVRESNVFNLYLMIFEGNAAGSKKIYGHYFDGSNLNASTEANWWTVDNMSDENDPATNGTLHIKAAKKSGCTVVAVANMNPNDLDVSAGLLSTIQTFGDLQGVVATQVRSEIAANSGFFLMTGQVDGVNIQGDDTDPNDLSYTGVGRKNILLKRLYAKVTFNVRVAKNPDPEKNYSEIRSFTPYKWQVVNVPSCAYLLERTTPGDPPTYDDAANSAGAVFTTEENDFEIEALTPDANDFYNDGVTKVSIHSFTFYMMENRHAPASGCDSYTKREKRVKPVSYTHGQFFDNGDYVYADPLSTYVILTGKIVMGTSANGNDNATLDANVRYEIHLGDFDSDPADFYTERNHNYVYNITIAGAEDIAAEVDNYSDSGHELDEPEPGATGRVVVALEHIFDSDCHYSTQVISFHARYMDPLNISWYVETPFNPDGVGGADVDAGRVPLTDIDYKWVEFFVNSTDNSGNYYNQQRAQYKPHDYNFVDINGDAILGIDKRKTMYVDELVTYLKNQKIQYDIDVDKMNPESANYDPDWEWNNDFDHDPGSDGPKISVTAFIDEYYYTRHPITKEYDPTLWKVIVNHPQRRMHILASSAMSADKESTKIGSSFTIQQRSIQSIYAVQETAGLQSAWGMEFKDETFDYDSNLDGLAYWRNKNAEDNGNTSSTNGRINSMKLWGVLNSDGTPNLVGQRWDKFLNLYGQNETPALWDKTDPNNPDPSIHDYNYLRHACLSRNRDLDGDEIIDADEIRWYMAADIQLIGVFLGSYGIEGDARLYQKSASDQSSNNKNKWRQHVLASNRLTGQTNSNQYPRIVWAEEGVNGSSMNYNGDDQTTVFSVRCVRNLGYYSEGGQRKDITLTDDPEVEPNPYIIMTRKHRENDGSITSPYSGSYDNNVFYEFDCSRINIASLREPVEHELIGHDENSKMACLSKKFVTAPVNDLISLTGKTAYEFNGNSYDLTHIETLNHYLDDCFPDLDRNFSICPEGYRLPNVREMAVMWTTLSPLGTESGFLGDSKTYPTRTHWSKGRDGSDYKSGDKNAKDQWGWGMNTQHMMMAKYTNETPKPRCVKDVF